MTMPPWKAGTTAFKVEAVHGERFKTRSEAKYQVFEYIEVCYLCPLGTIANGFTQNWAILVRKLLKLKKSLSGVSVKSGQDHFALATKKWTQFGGTSENTPGFTGKFYESVEMEVPWNFYPAVDNVPASKIWTFVEASTGAIGPIRIKAQYGEPVIHRIHNALPTDNGGFGINQTTTHLHNGHTPSESDGGPIHFYDAGKFKDYHYPNVRAGFASNVPTSGLNGRTVIGDFKETMSSLWFHDHRSDFTSQNVYKGLVGVYSLFSNDILLDTDN